MGFHLLQCVNYLFPMIEQHPVDNFRLEKCVGLKGLLKIMKEH